MPDTILAGCKPYHAELALSEKYICKIIVGLSVFESVASFSLFLVTGNNFVEFLINTGNWMINEVKY